MARLSTLLQDHLYLLVFLSTLIEATGIPFPSRVILILAGALAVTSGEAVRVVLAAFVGALIGDHVLYGAGMSQGTRLLSLYCRVTLASDRCIENTVRHFRRFGPPAVALARFSTALRLFAAILSGCGHIPYWRFVLFDVVGTAVYCTLWAGAGFLVGEQLIELFHRLPAARLIVLIVPAAMVVLLLYRIYRRRRYGRALVEGVLAGAGQGTACEIADTRPTSVSSNGATG
jgi:membrane protein DedA with SNARE-associated domain